MGLDAWRGLPHVPDLVLRPGAPDHAPGHHGKRATNGVYLLKQWPYEADKLAITVITYEMDTGRLLDADVLVNGETSFAVLNERAKRDPHERMKTYDLPAVLTHEIGHLLGLGESDADPDATMWPYATPGETQKRTLSEDDEDGVIASYRGKAPLPASGCGALSVAGGKRGQQGLFVAALVVFALAWRGTRRQRAKAALRSGAAIAIAIAIVGFGEPVHTTDVAEQMRTRLRALEDARSSDAQVLLHVAARHDDARARLDAVEALARVGTRDERALLERLASDEDAEVASRARETLSQVMGRAPRVVLAASSTEGRALMAQLLGRGHQLVSGRAHRVATVEQDGLLHTEYEVRSADGKLTRLRVAGGTLGAIGQRVLDAEPPPADDLDLVVAPQPDGRTRWAYSQAGRIFGGHLGEAAVAY
jgi:hypothetical protein